MEIRLREMNPNDEIKIRTQFSDYSFRVTDPVESRGVLCGGQLNQEHEAVFVEIVRPTNSTKPISGQLEPGDRAVFMFGRDALKKLTTSAITAIVVSEMRSTAVDD